ncbi:MAG: Gfo/Idh/MocA family oxidoreductase [Propionibacteriaceae bacterium]|nr:Gfo/Idh/MocA family oxidoreductase [Propionibacteriaceae bacterium]
MEALLNPADAPTLRWGVLGCGQVARSVMTCLRRATKQKPVAVAARSAARAQSFAQEFEIPSSYGSYAELVADPDVDVVYIATVHSTHFDNAKLALEAGKPVLLEKAFTMNQAEARTLADLAASKGLFLMEALWTRFLPHMVELRNRINSGALGELRYAHADFGFRNDYDPATRFYDPAVGGGALLDRGVYPVSWVVGLMGLPEAVSGRAVLTPDGVDAQISAVLDYPSQSAQALVESALNVTTPQEAWAAGSDGMVRVRRPFWIPTVLEIHQAGRDVETWEHPVVARGYEYELAEVARQIAAGATESPAMPLRETVAIMGILDELRSQCGIKFPGETP